MEVVFTQSEVNRQNRLTIASNQIRIKSKAGASTEEIEKLQRLGENLSRQIKKCSHTLRGKLKIEEPRVSLELADKDKTHGCGVVVDWNSCEIIRVTPKSFHASLHVDVNPGAYEEFAKLNNL